VAVVVPPVWDLEVGASAVEVVVEGAVAAVAVDGNGAHFTGRESGEHRYEIYICKSKSL